MKFIITGGVNHKGNGLFKNDSKVDYGYISILDWGEKKIVRHFNYETPKNKINHHITKELTCGQIYDKDLYVTSRTEVIIFDIEKLKIKKKITHPTFHDLHHVARIDNQIFIANTGLEMVQRFSLDGDELEQINLTNIPTWKRFDKKLDYRLVKSTKPHKMHVNYIFERYHGEIWATCLIPKEAVCIYGGTGKIKIDEGYIHDGHVSKDSIYFTTTNGLIIVFDIKTLKKTKTYDIFTQYKKRKDGNLGWCRGVCIVNMKAYVGFTSLRPTKNKELLDKLRRKNKSVTTRIIEIDLIDGEVIDEYVLPYKRSTVFSIIRMDVK